ncbi:hypothetical protein SLH46_07635 [Draconibacterium sp. IB214405]|uniref:hypothetical protein n=1 Tax=Draconibacterium sp. IB214405 TaxID=3097352 RepID=UPI002A1545D8|nr:hypothetical protein [Draconibacterium sp. IB214405]MDX8339050.1 hypothetical protein [Draconibacterium sp. IB214405]
MNRTTSVTLHGIGKTRYGYYILIALDRYPDLYQKFKDKMRGLGNFTNPLPMVKYLIRNDYVIDKERNLTLPALTGGSDKYEIVKNIKFSGQFSYDSHHGGFVPMYTEVEMTKWLKSIHEKYEKKLITNAWEKAKTYLTLSDGSDPVLKYDIN